MQNNVSIFLLPIVLMIAGNSFSDNSDNNDEELFVCKSPRPEVCNQEYKPVCAERANNIQCVRAPCPASDFVTMSNACRACSDIKVNVYRAGECEILNWQSF